MKRNYDVLFTGGGSGGHVFPGIAVIESLRAKACDSIAWIGSRKGPEAGYVRANNIPFFAVTAGKFHRYFTFKIIAQVFKILLSFVQAMLLLIRIRPRVVVSMGSYVSVPPVWAARVLGIPLVVHICDHSLSLASRLSVKHAQHILLSYDSVYDRVLTLLGAGRRNRVAISRTGYPVRPSVLRGDGGSYKARHSLGSAPLVLALGGSQGSHEINALVDYLYANSTIPLAIIHQCGGDVQITQPQVTRTLTQGQGSVQRLQSQFFSDEYPNLLSAADIVISRAGAGTLWEIAAYQIPALLIPLSQKGSRGDQIENAEYFAAIGAAINLGSNPRNDEFIDAVYRLLQNDSTEIRQNLRQNLQQLKAQEASQKIAQVIIECLVSTNT